MASDRRRNFAFIAYPDDGLPDNWLEILRSLHVNIAISPLHSPDPSPGFDESGFLVNKKRHYHVVIAYDGVKTFNQVINDLSPLGDHITKPFEVHSLSGYLRYLVHQDDPGKEQFGDDPLERMESITCLGSMMDSVQLAFSVGEFDAFQVMGEIMDFIYDNSVKEMTELYVYCQDMPKWRYVLQKYSCKPIYALLNSIRYQSGRN